MSAGNCVKGEACGLGILCLSDGEVYKGEFSKNQRHGKGELVLLSSLRFLLCGDAPGLAIVCSL